MTTMTEHQLRNHLQTAMSDPHQHVITMSRPVAEALAELLNEQAQKLHVLEVGMQEIRQVMDGMPDA